MRRSTSMSSSGGAGLPASGEAGIGAAPGHGHGWIMAAGGGCKVEVELGGAKRSAGNGRSRVAGWHQSTVDDRIPLGQSQRPKGTAIQLCLLPGGLVRVE